MDASLQSLAEAASKVAYGLRDLAVGVALALTPGPDELVVASLGAVRGAAVADRIVDATTGALRTSETVANQLKAGGVRDFIPSNAILEAVRGGTRAADPQGVAGHYMYTIGASYGKSTGMLEVLVDEASNEIRHVLYRAGR